MNWDGVIDLGGGEITIRAFYVGFIQMLLGVLLLGIGIGKSLKP